MVEGVSVEAAQPDQAPFTFVDLFAGIGGFHAALGALGGQCWFSSEIDPACRRVYEANWGTETAGDIVPLTPDDGPVQVPPHDVLAAGFPCQPFSKSGFQHGFRDTSRGTLFFNICRVLEEHRPPVVLLENVRNLAGPRQHETWATIVNNLRDLGYRVSGSPAVFSPHLLPPERGGAPQVRERVFVAGTHVGARRARREVDLEPVVRAVPVEGWDPQSWDLRNDLPLDHDIGDPARYQLSAEELRMLGAWNEFLGLLDEERLPTFPVWADAFRYPAVVPAGTPTWKASFLRKNAELYERNRAAVDGWLERHDHLRWLPESRRKLEWQAQDGERDLLAHVLHLRPSGIRVKRATYLPALVAITQTSIYGPWRRRITPREAARLQGLPDWFDFGGQPDALTYRQLGNGVSVGAAYHVLREHVRRDADDLPSHITTPVLQAAPLPVVPQRRHGGPVDRSAGESSRHTAEAGVGGRGEASAGLGFGPLRPHRGFRYGPGAVAVGAEPDPDRVASAPTTVASAWDTCRRVASCARCAGVDPDSRRRFVKEAVGSGWSAGCRHVPGRICAAGSSVTPSPSCCCARPSTPKAPGSASNGSWRAAARLTSCSPAAGSLCSSTAAGGTPAPGTAGRRRSPALTPRSGRPRWRGTRSAT